MKFKFRFTVVKKDGGLKFTSYYITQPVELFDRLIKLRGREGLHNIRLIHRNGDHECVIAIEKRKPGLKDYYHDVKTRFDRDDLTNLDKLEQLAQEVWDSTVWVNDSRGGMYDREGVKQPEWLVGKGGKKKKAGYNEKG